eukprot:COSAG05_NODE_780_length_7383_cov_123.317408_1_plen_541_part_00
MRALPPWARSVLQTSYAALPAGTGLLLRAVFGALVAVLAALLLRPSVLRAGVKNVLPFLAVAGSTVLAFLLPVAVGTALTGLGMLSFGPIVATYMAGNWLLLPQKLKIFLAVFFPLGIVACVGWIYQAGRRARGRGGGLLWQAAHFLRVWMVFALPFYSVFVVALVGAFSLVWGLSIGAFIFVQGEVFADWSGGARRRWPRMLALCEMLFAGEIFEYFPISIRMAATALLRATGKAPALHADRKYLFCYHPHGVYAFGLFALLFGGRSGFFSLFLPSKPPHTVAAAAAALEAAAGGAAATGGADRLSAPTATAQGTSSRTRPRRYRSPSNSPPSPSSDGRCGGRDAVLETRPRGMIIGVANALLHVPVVSSFFAWFGFVAASYGSLAEACTSEYNVAVVPGGIAEMTAYRDSSTEILVLRSRLGFVRLAMQHGRALVPVYGFGENRAFTQSSCCRSLRRHFARRTRLALHMFYGRWYTLIPYQRPIAVVVGSPIDMAEAIAEPTDEQVRAVHALYCERVRELYYAHRDAYGYGNVELELV